MLSSNSLRSNAQAIRLNKCLTANILSKYAGGQVVSIGKL